MIGSNNIYFTKMHFKEEFKTEPKVIQFLTGLTYCTGICLTFYLIIFSGIKVHHDCAYFLHLAQHMLRGAVPYVDFSAINPPLGNYIHVIPVLLSYILKISIPLSFYLTVTFLTITSSVLVYLILLKSDTFKSLLSIAIISIAVVLISLTILSWGHYGQREHLFILGYLPFVFLREARYRNKSFPLLLTVVVGLMMSLFALFKPHFVFVAAVVEIWLLLRTRNWKCLLKPEVLVAVGMGFAYLLHFLLVPKSMFHAFFYRWVPLVLSHYDVYNTSRFKVLYFFPVLKTWVIFIGTSLAFAFIQIKWKRESMLVGSFFFSMFAAYGIHVFQHKGFQNHIYPFVALLIMFWIVIIMILLENLKIHFQKNKSVWKSVRTLSILILLGFIHFKYFQYGMRTFYLSENRYPNMPKYLELIDKYSQSDDKVTFIATAETPVYPTLLYANRFHGSRYVTSMLIAMYYEGVVRNEDGSFPYRTESDWTKEERQFLEELGEDIINNQPKLVFVHTGGHCNGCPEGFQVYEYLQKSGWWDRYFKDYTYLTSLEDFNVYLHHSKEYE